MADKFGDKFENAKETLEGLREDALNDGDTETAAALKRAYRELTLLPPHVDREPLTKDEVKDTDGLTVKAHDTSTQRERDSQA